MTPLQSTSKILHSFLEGGTPWVPHIYSSLLSCSDSPHSPSRSPSEELGRPSSKSRCVDRARDGRPRHRRTSQPQELGFVADLGVSEHVGPSSRTPGNIAALMIRIRFWGPLYDNYNKEPQNWIGNYLSLYSSRILPLRIPGIKYEEFAEASAGHFQAASW